MTDRDAIRQTIVQGYIEGIHLDQDEAKVRAGFHPEFRMLVPRDAEISKVDPGAFLNMMKERRAADPSAFETELSYEIPLIEVEGSAGTARVELYRGGNHLFTDFLLLLKFPDGWKIVSKIFHRQA